MWLNAFASHPARRSEPRSTVSHRASFMSVWASGRCLPSSLRGSGLGGR
jgi:hypothetical protein